MHTSTCNNQGDGLSRKELEEKLNFKEKTGTSNTEAQISRVGSLLICIDSDFIISQQGRTAENSHNTPVRDIIRAVEVA